MENLAAGRPPAQAVSGRLEVATATDVGRERELNEDTVWGAALDEGADNPWRLSALLVVADGMGGHDAGEVASNLAAQTVREVFASPQAELALDDLAGQNLLRRVSEAVQYVNRVVHARGEGNGAARPGTTLTVCLARAQEYVVGHVGDSRAYLICRSDIEQVTADDSLVAEAVRRGHMSEEEARGSQFRNQITKAVGLRPEVEPSVYYGHWQTGDVLLLCSDGLTEYVTSDEMLQHVQSGDSLQQVCESLIALANKRGGHDNISVAAARFLPIIGTNAAAQPARKPKTWPPANAPAKNSASPQTSVPPNPAAEATQSTLNGALSRESGQKKQRRVSWLLLAIVCGVLAAGAGLWLGLWTSGNQKNGAKADKAGNDSTVLVSPPGETATMTPDRHSVSQPIAPVLKIGRDEANKRFFISCPGYKVQAQLSPRPAIKVESKGANATITVRSYANTVTALQESGRLLLFRGDKPDGKPIAESAPESVSIKFDDIRAGQEYSLFFRADKNAPSRIWTSFKVVRDHN